MVFSAAKLVSVATPLADANAGHQGMHSEAGNIGVDRNVLQPLRAFGPLRVRKFERLSRLSCNEVQGMSSVGQVVCEQYRKWVLRNRSASAIFIVSVEVASRHHVDSNCDGGVLSYSITVKYYGADVDELLSVNRCS